MIYFYARVSTKSQNLDRQLEISKEYFKEKNYLNVLTYQEKQSGKDFKSRDVYQRLRKAVKKGDTVILLSLDRLGRNYDEIQEEWDYLTKKKCCEIEVIDMPILNTNNNINGLDGKFISDLVLKILSYLAQKEREKIKERQEQGIKTAKEKGVKFGRPKKELDKNLIKTIFTKYHNKELKVAEAIAQMKVSKGTFYRLYGSYYTHTHTHDHPAKKSPTPKKIFTYKVVELNGSITNYKHLKDIASKYYVSQTVVTNYIKTKNPKSILADYIVEIKKEEQL